MILAHTPLAHALGGQAQIEGCANRSVHPTGQRPCDRLIVRGPLVGVGRRERQWGQDVARSGLQRLGRVQQIVPLAIPIEPPVGIGFEFDGLDRGVASLENDTLLLERHYEVLERLNGRPVMTALVRQAFDLAAAGVDRASSKHGFAGTKGRVVDHPLVRRAGDEPSLLIHDENVIALERHTV